MQDHKAGPVRQRLLRAQHGGGLGGRAAPTNAPQTFPFDLGCWLLALHPVGETQPQDLFPQTRHNLGEKSDQISLTPSLLGPEEGAPRQGERALYSKHSLVWGLLSPLALAPYDGGRNSQSILQGSWVWKSVRAQLTLCRAWAGVPMGKPRRRTMHGALEMMRTM